MGYKALNKQIYGSGEFSIVPIRMEDRYAIMKWRNEQIYHLRQAEPLTAAKQDSYFENVVAALFDQERPKQLLFSFLKRNLCIGYGGLVHINWIDKNAEVSFVMNTELQKQLFKELWQSFLCQLRKVAFKELDFHKIFTYAFDIRPELYEALLGVGFVEDSRLNEHCQIEGNYYDVVIHSHFNPSHHLSLKAATIKDSKLFFDWANDAEVRQNAFCSESILWDNHEKWFSGKLSSQKSKLYIFIDRSGIPVGQVRLDLEKGEWVIDYSIDKSYRGLGLGKILIERILEYLPDINLLAKVKPDNVPSLNIFRNLGFKEIQYSETTAYFSHQP
jgi:RimJ/RimL family protein N-acetyltransferase